MKTTYTAFCQSNAVRTYAPSVCETVRKAPKSQLLVPGTDKPEKIVKSARRSPRMCTRRCRRCSHGRAGPLPGTAAGPRPARRRRSPLRDATHCQRGVLLRAVGTLHVVDGCPGGRSVCGGARGARAPRAAERRSARHPWDWKRGRRELCPWVVVEPVADGAAARSTEQAEPRIEARDDQKMSKCPQLGNRA